MEALVNLKDKISDNWLMAGKNSSNACFMPAATDQKPSVSRKKGEHSSPPLPSFERKWEKGGNFYEPRNRNFFACPAI